MYTHAGIVILNEPLEYDHLLQPFLEQSDIDASDPPLMSGDNLWWGDGGMMAAEVGLLSHNIVIQGRTQATVYSGNRVQNYTSLCKLYAWMETILMPEL